MNTKPKFWEDWKDVQERLGEYEPQVHITEKRVPKKKAPVRSPGRPRKVIVETPAKPVEEQKPSRNFNWIFWWL